jgi:hypothetical protein
MKHCRYLAILTVLLAAAVTLQACGKNSSSSGTGSSTPSGTLSVMVTDAPGDFDHVYITVKNIWFHTSETAGPADAYWLKRPLTAPVTVDLISLANGNLQSVWDSISLPVGTYQQIRVILAGTEDPLTASAQALNLQYNNEVISGGEESPLHVPDALHGIRLIGAFKVAETGTLRLAIDFDAGHDIADFRNGEYILKPRLAYFDLDNVGAIVGTLATGGTFTRSPRFVVKAERLTSDGTRTYHEIRRWTVPRSDGTFVLYPVSTLVTNTWDVVIRGLNYQTVIIKDVPITRGATPTSGATDLGSISMTAADSQDYQASAAIPSPTGAWLTFNQTLPGAGEYPYVIRFRHFHPLSGTFTGFPLSNMPISVGSYSTGSITFSDVIPQEGIGGYIAAADAVLFDRGDYQPVTSSTPSVAIPALTVTSPYQGNSVTGTISMTMPVKMNNRMDKGVLFAVHGGMIVNAMDVGSQMATGGTYTMNNLPGGSSATPLPGGFYGIEALGWSSTPMPLSMLPYAAVAIPQVVDLRTGSDTAGMQMVPLW